MPWEKLKIDRDLDELVWFSKVFYPTIGGMPDGAIRRFFTIYSETTWVYYIDRAIQGFATYQDWPEFLNFIAICLTGTKMENYRAIKANLHLLPDKPVMWFNEKTKKVRRL